MRVLVVFHKLDLLVVIKIDQTKFRTAETILDWYAKAYAIDRTKLTGKWADQINEET